MGWEGQGELYRRKEPQNGKMQISGVQDSQSLEHFSGAYSLACVSSPVIVPLWSMLHMAGMLHHALFALGTGMLTGGGSPQTFHAAFLEHIFHCLPRPP